MLLFNKTYKEKEREGQKTAPLKNPLATKLAVWRNELYADTDPNYIN